MSEKIEIDTTVRTVEIISIGTQGPAGPQGPSGEPDYEAINELHTLINSLAASKLDKTEYVQHFRGLFSSYAALVAALPTALNGDYAHIDSGSGFDRMSAIWDGDDQKWIVQDVNVGANTDEVPEGSTNLYFKAERVLATLLTSLNTSVDAAISTSDSIIQALGKLQGQLNNLASKVRSTVLTGFSTSNTTPVVATDTVLQALGKVQGQISAIAPPVWVPASEVGVAASGVDVSLFEFAKINGMLFCRGFIKIGSPISSGGTVFTITNNSYKVIRPLVGGGAQMSGNLPFYISASTTYNLRFMVTGSSTDVSSASTSTQLLQSAQTLSINSEYFAVQHNFCFGQLITP